LHAGTGGALLQIASLINHQHPARVTQMLGHIAADVIAHAIGVPPGPRQQVLHPSRAGVPRMLGDTPAVRSWQPGQQAQHKRPRPPPRLHPAETNPDTEHQLIEDTQPPAGVYAVASGHRQIVMRRHKP
jgi:hypothetical protein